MNTQYNLDVPYFKGKLTLILRDLPRYTPEELSRELMRLGRTASPMIAEGWMWAH